MASTVESSTDLTWRYDSGQPELLEAARPVGTPVRDDF